MPKKERKVICPRCHRTIPRGELAKHMRQHKGRPPRHMRAAHATKRRKTTVPRHVCDCGLQFETRQEAREHMKKCKQIRDIGQACSVCSTFSDILLPWDNLLVCPTCATGFFESTMVSGSPLINHMGIEYEDIFRDKMEVLLPRLGAEKLSELSIDVVLITFARAKDSSHALFRHSHNPKGELIFMFTQASQVPEMEKKVFESVINHEVFHAYITHRLKLGISDKLKGPFTFMEGFAAQLAEDIQLDKIAVEDNVWPLIVDEIKRTTIYFEKASPPISANRWNALPDVRRLQGMTSVTWTYAVESWFAKVLRQSEVRGQLSRNLKLVYPHYSVHGYADLKDLILQLFDERITKTEKESETMFERLLSVYDEYADAHNLILY